ncbi:hypothetical protein BpHYR1_009948 [Brachionus plicatilis]|uniref:Uncharacterized protein n=1 Tax=Brachionus plicatilis TaxID=10195 RepID=A0A3M7QJ23_BRAPC|nr:hypothetical protein BpHYR1_009948 [Brachionus plicatilis]
MKRKVIALIVQLFVLISSQIVLSEYVSEDDPPCVEDCNSVPLSEKSKCIQAYAEFYNYRMVKSVFNFAKVSVYAGLWNSRYEKADPMLFERVFMNTLNQYNDPAILGKLSFETLNKTALYLYERLKVWTKKREPSNAIPFESYPSLKCPTPCIYDLVTWQSLFYISLVIFVLALFTVLFYSIFLRRQYVSLRNRFKNSKFSKVNQES